MSQKMIREQRLPKKAIALVLAGGRGSRLQDLTDKRSKPAVFFGGKFRIIDFVLSNCINSGIRRVSVLTQYKSHSLLRHLQRTWNFLRPELNEYIDFLPAQQRLNDEKWYQGTADAVWQNHDIINSRQADHVLILAGDHIYKMDYARMLAEHSRRNADCSVACVEVKLQEASRFGVMTVGEEGKVESFIEKPNNPLPSTIHPDYVNASMGIYIFKSQVLMEALQADQADPTSSHDFGRDIIPKLVAQGRVYAHDFVDSCVNIGEHPEPYWRDVGTLDSYWEANMDLTDVVPALNLYDRDWPIWTYQAQLPPAKFIFDDNDGRRGQAIDSIISGGCIVSGASIQKSLLFSLCEVHEYSVIKQSVLLPDVYIGKRARINKVVIDRGCIIPDDFVVGEDPHFDATHFYRSPNGVVLITKARLAALGYPQKLNH